MNLQLLAIQVFLKSSFLTNHNSKGNLEIINQIKYIECIPWDLEISLRTSCIYDTPWKVSKYGIFLGPIFPVFASVKAPYLDTFHKVHWTESNSEYVTHHLQLIISIDLEFHYFQFGRCNGQIIEFNRQWIL